jgi:hypothetical protein
VTEKKISKRVHFWRLGKHLLLFFKGGVIITPFKKTTFPAFLRMQKQSPTGDQKLKRKDKKSGPFE